MALPAAVWVLPLADCGVADADSVGGAASVDAFTSGAFVQMKQLVAYLSDLGTAPAETPATASAAPPSAPANHPATEPAKAFCL